MHMVPAQLPTLIRGSRLNLSAWSQSLTIAKKSKPSEAESQARNTGYPDDRNTLTVAQPTIMRIEKKSKMKESEGGEQEEG